MSGDDPAPQHNPLARAHLPTRHNARNHLMCHHLGTRLPPLFGCGAPSQDVHTKAVSSYGSKTSDEVQRMTLPRNMIRLGRVRLPVRPPARHSVRDRLAVTASALARPPPLAVKVSAGTFA